MPANGYSDFLAYMIDHCAVPGDEQTILQLFRALSAPKLKLKRRFFPPEDGKPAVPDAEVEPIAHDHTMLRAYRSKIQPHLDVFAKGIALIVTTTFEEANALLVMYGKAGPKWDPISMSRGSVTSRAQDFLHNGFSVLIDAGADVLRWANEHDSKFAFSSDHAMDRIRLAHSAAACDQWDGRISAFDFGGKAFLGDHEPSSSRMLVSRMRLSRCLPRYMPVAGR